MNTRRNIIGYIDIKPVPRQIPKNFPYYGYSFEPIFGVLPIFINDNGEYQIFNSTLGIVSKNCRHVYYLYLGNMVYLGNIVEWSKKPIIRKKDKIQEYKRITDEINKLKESRSKLLMN